MPTALLISSRASGYAGTITQANRSITISDRSVQTNVQRGLYADCLNNLLLRGTYGTGAFSGWVVTSSVATREANNLGTLTVTYEAGGPYMADQFLQQAEWDVQPVELYPKIERHRALTGTNWPGDITDCISADTIQKCYEVVHGPTKTARDAAAKQVVAIEDTKQRAWANQLIEWWKRGIETYYLAGMKYTWTTYSKTLPTLSLGGFIQEPQGALAGCFPSTLNFLRMCDVPAPAGVVGSAFKVTSTWVGGPLGHWDPTVYPSA